MKCASHDTTLLTCCIVYLRYCQQEPVLVFCTVMLDLHQSRAMLLIASQIVVDDDVMFDRLSHSDNTHVERHTFPDGGLTPKHRVPCPVSLQDMR